MFWCFILCARYIFFAVIKLLLKNSRENIANAKLMHQKSPISEPLVSQLKKSPNNNLK